MAQRALRLAEPHREGMAHALPLIDMVCRLAGPTNFVAEGRGFLARQGVIGAVRTHDTNVLFNWLMTTLSYQGIADRVAKSYLAEHGSVTRPEVTRALRRKPSCPKLSGFWLFSGCGYEKGSGACGEPSHIAACPVPKHPLRNGRLNQTAYSLALFIRDVAQGDLVQWIDNQLVACETAARDTSANSPSSGDTSASDDLAAMRQAIVEPLCGVYGISDKVVTMAMSSLFLGAGARKHLWMEVGASFVVVDTLVHNFLHRTGILHALDADHMYGPGCYRPGGCADVLYKVSDQIDARTFNPAFPATFPRFVQLAIWRYCSESGRDICNGNQIDDLAPCANAFCQLHDRCKHVTLHAKNSEKMSIFSDLCAIDTSCRW